MVAQNRRVDLDWLRVVCILGVHLFHVGMFFNSWEWHVKSPSPLPSLEIPMEVMHMVRMPLLMLIAGAATALALERRNLGAFAVERVKRLLWPLVFAIFLVVPPQIYAERVWRGQFHGSYAAFWPSVLDFVSYPKGSFSWHHLWFVAYLFTFCLLALPLFAWFRGERGRAFLARAERFLARGANLWWLALGIFGGRFLLRDFPETHDLVRDPKTLVFFGGLFLAGHLLGRMPALEARLVELRRAHTVLFCVLLPLALVNDALPMPLGHLAYYGAIWAFLCAALGHARHRLRKEMPWLRHAQSLAYPFYILHQTVIVVLGWRLLPLGWGPWAMLGVLLPGSFLVTWGLCEGVARVAWLRPCLGMGPIPRRPGATTSVGGIMPEEAS